MGDGERPQAAKTTYREAMREALRDALRADDRVFLMGEDVGRYGGGFGVSLGLLEEFGPARVRDTPLSESAFVGAGIGAALAGLRPIVEIMTVNFSLLALDQILNNAATTMPSLGADMDEGTLLEWLLGPGDLVHKGDPVAVVETAKSTIEVECFETGTMAELLVETGTTVPVGTPLARIGVPAKKPEHPEGERKPPRTGKPRMARQHLAETEKTEKAEKRRAARRAQREPAKPPPRLPNPPHSRPQYRPPLDKASTPRRARWSGIWRSKAASTWRRCTVPDPEDASPGPTSRKRWPPEPQPGNRARGQPPWPGGSPPNWAWTWPW